MRAGGAAAVADLLQPEVLLPLLYLAVGVTFGAQWLQTLGQSSVSAADAAVIYALDPV